MRLASSARCLVDRLGLGVVVELVEVVVEIVGEASRLVVAVAVGDSNGEPPRCLELRPLK